MKPASVLFACTLNAVRSPIAAALARSQFGRSIYFECAGVRAGQLDPLAVAVMAEKGIDLSHYHPKTLADLSDTSFDLIVALSPDAMREALRIARTCALDVEHWQVPEPMGEGARDQRLAEYRAIRDGLAKRIAERFGAASVSGCGT